VPAERKSDKLRTATMPAILATSWPRLTPMVYSRMATMLPFLTMFFSLLTIPKSLRKGIGYKIKLNVVFEECF
jgi:hypothetical protein